MQNTNNHQKPFNLLHLFWIVLCIISTYNGNPLTMSISFTVKHISQVKGKTFVLHIHSELIIVVAFLYCWGSRFPSSIISFLLKNRPSIILWVDHWNQLIFLLYKNMSLFNFHSSMIFSPDTKFWVESIFFQHLKILSCFLGSLYFLMRNWITFKSLLCRIQSKITHCMKNQENPSLVEKTTIDLCPLLYKI